MTSDTSEYNKLHVLIEAVDLILKLSVTDKIQTVLLVIHVIKLLLKTTYMIQSLSRVTC